MGQSAHSSAPSSAPWEFHDFSIPICLRLDPLHPKWDRQPIFHLIPPSFQTSVLKHLPAAAMFLLPSPCPELPQLKLTRCSSLQNPRCYKAVNDAIFLRFCTR